VIIETGLKIIITLIEATMVKQHIMKQNHHDLNKTYGARSLGMLKNCNSFCQLDDKHPEADHKSPPFIPQETIQSLQHHRGTFYRQSLR
jgi:hypothetical protein